MYPFYWKRWLTESSFVLCHPAVAICWSPCGYSIVYFCYIWTKYSWGKIIQTFKNQFDERKLDKTVITKQLVLLQNYTVVPFHWLLIHYFQCLFNQQIILSMNRCLLSRQDSWAHGDEEVLLKYICQNAFFTFPSSSLKTFLVKVKKHCFFQSL